MDAIEHKITLERWAVLQRLKEMRLRVPKNQPRLLVWLRKLAGGGLTSTDKVADAMNYLQEEGAIVILTTGSEKRFFSPYGDSGAYCEILFKNQFDEIYGRYESIITQTDREKKKGGRQKKIIKYEVQPTRRFFCKKTKEEYLFRKENEKGTILIALAFSNTLGEWLDNVSDNPEGTEPSLTFEGRQMCDAARGVNKNFREKFNLDKDLFEVDFPNKKVKILLNTSSFKITQ
jgi:hypothetical protein